MTRWLREPLFHFLVAGVLLFALMAWWSDGEPGGGFAKGSASEQSASRRIRVERDALLAFVQLRTKSDDAVGVARAFDAADEATRRDWLDRFVREEALVREARALGLDRDDELIRRRLAQKIEFLTLGALDDVLRVTPAELEAYYREHAEDHRIPVRLTFTHVFLRSPAEDQGPASRKDMPGQTPEAARDRTREQVREESLALRRVLESQHVGFEGARGYGDRFLYNRQYVDRTLDEVRSHFGDEMANALLEIPVDETRWSGPHASPHGWHLVLLTRRSESGVPPLEAIADLLSEDLLREKRRLALEASVAEIVSRYEIDVDASIESGR